MRRCGAMLVVHWERLRFLLSDADVWVLKWEERVTHLFGSSDCCSCENADASGTEKNTHTQKQKLR